MIELPKVIVVCATTKDYGKSIIAIKKTLEQIRPAKVLFFTDVLYMDDDWQNIIIDPFRSVEDYNHFIFKKLGSYLYQDGVTHVLVIQHDGYVLDGNQWTDDFLDYDYIGAPWTYTDGRNVGNGGFSLRSTKLHTILMNDEFEYYSPEDEKISRYYRQTLQKKYGIKYAPDVLAHKFSFEMHKPQQPTFGFHNYFYEPYKEPIVLRRKNCGIGDVIMMEPVMEELHKKGFRVILDVLDEYYGIFSNHRYPVELFKSIVNEPKHQFRVVDLDMVYEVLPKQLVVKSYAHALGIEVEPRNAKLAYYKHSGVRLFDKYIVIHNDDTAMTHRNVHGVNWDDIVNFLELNGWTVLRVGRGNGKGGLKINTGTDSRFLAWFIAGADYFIGIDSGCAQIAVACGVKSVIFFGSVNPVYRYVLNDDIKIIQAPCPIGKDYCYHEVISTVGQVCEVNEKKPPCITHSNNSVWEQIKQFIPCEKFQ